MQNDWESATHKAGRAVVALIGAKESATAARHFGTTERLQRYVEQATQKVDKLGDAALTPRQFYAATTNPNLRQAFRGNRIHVSVRQSVMADPKLHYLQSNYRSGPDFIDARINRWYDITTPEQWNVHLQKYNHGGTLLPTRGLKR